tara:strand:- start:877 stop:1173 length:297 start_codon:yes stop_codon:yes gene_type:complete
MNKITFIFVALLSFVIAKDDKVNLKIAGMQCAYSCADKVTKVVENIKGVKDCKVDFANNTATIVFDDKKLDSKEIVSVLKKKTSYKVEIQTEKKVESI